MKFTHEVNDKIQAPEVRCLSNNGEMIGVISTSSALDMAEKQDLDLVVINPQANPPIAKIIDYGKFKYELTQADKERRKKSRANIVEVKEIQLRPVTDTHDVQIKAKRAAEFLKDGNKVRVVVRFKGRELSHNQMGEKIIASFCSLVGEDSYKVDAPLAFAGRQMSMTLAPIKKNEEQGT